MRLSSKKLSKEEVDMVYEGNYYAYALDQMREEEGIDRSEKDDQRYHAGIDTQLKEGGEKNEGRKRPICVCHSPESADSLSRIRKKSSGVNIG